LGYNLKQRRKLAYQIGTVFGQRPQLWYHLPAVDTFSFIGKIYEMEDAPSPAISFLAEAFEIPGFTGNTGSEAPTGQRMRWKLPPPCCIARLLLLDDASIGLDVVKGIIRDTVRMNELEGGRVLLTSRDAGDIEALCRNVIVIHHGQIVYQDKVSTLKRLPYLKNESGALR
jgi:ABC-2 type transport system ATP-binding protein